MNDPSATVTCHVHKTTVTRAGANAHHITPQAAGGGNEKGNLVWLCATCHSILHRAEEMLSKGKGGSVTTLIATSYQRADQRSRMSSLVKAAAAAFQEADESGFATDDVTITISREVFERLQVVAQGVRDPTSGRRVGVGRMIDSILRAYLRSKGIAIPPAKG